MLLDFDYKDGIVLKFIGYDFKHNTELSEIILPFTCYTPCRVIKHLSVLPAGLGPCCADGQTDGLETFIYF